MLHQDLTFYETDDNFYLVPKNNADNMVLVINRQSGDVGLQDQKDISLCNLCAFSIKSICGIFGVIQLIACKYLILITQLVKVGEILSEPIFRVESVELVPYQAGELHLTEEQRRYNGQYLQMVTTFLQAPFFYLSYTYDLSHSLQSLHAPVSKQTIVFNQSLFHRADKQFVWNGHLMKDFANNKELDSFCIPIIYGFFSMHKIEVNQKQFTLILVSRRSVNRAGTRLFSRGVDEHGHVSNFVETEQIVLYNQERASFVQIRGSIPLHWSQLPDLRYKPPPTLAPTQPHHESFARHVRALLPQFESMVMVNLVNHTGQEEPLLSKFRQVFHDTVNDNLQPNSSSAIVLECFDFHHECRRDRWDRLSVLLDSVSRHIDSHGYFATVNKGTGEEKDYRFQSGCFRTNCIDSLDRTNVVQSLIAKSSLERQLQHFDIIAIGQRVEDFASFYHVYRNVWADNADACSIQYAGTPALKTDFTRTGKRRLVGKLKDGVNAMVRYYKNNFEDGFRQDAIDLVLGNYQVSPNEGNTARCPLGNRNILKILTFPLFLLLSIGMFFFSLLLPTEHLTEKFLYLLFWFSMSSSCIAFMFHYELEFVDSPTLVHSYKKNK